MENNAKRKRNLGIEILRMFLCFNIVIKHYYTSNNINILKLKNSRFQVPCFFFISFYFLYNIISKRDSEKLKLRLQRLLVPYTIHPIINWIINNLMFLIFKFNRYNRFLSLYDLTKQFIVGRGIYGIAVLWFIFHLIFFTLFFFIFSSLLKNHYLSISQFLAIISYRFQYLQINYYAFKKYTEVILMSVGNFIETFPVAVYAFSLSFINFHEILLKNRIKSLCFSFLFLYLLYNYNIFVDIKGFSSIGIKQIFFSTFLFSFFFVLPIEILNSKLLSIIKQLTKFTQGIYCLHFVFQYYFRLKFEKNGTFVGCMLLYIICYLVSFFGFNIFARTKLRFLFV